MPMVSRKTIQLLLPEMSTEALSPGEMLSAPIVKAYKEGRGVDFALICQGEIKMVHSQVQGKGVCWVLGGWSKHRKKLLAILTIKPHPLSQVIMTSSPFLEAKVTRWSKEKKELVIEDCNTITFTILDHVYGIEIPESVIFEDMQIYIKLLEMSDMWLMDNLKASLEELFAKHLFQSLPFPNLEGKRLLRACARDRESERRGRPNYLPIPPSSFLPTKQSLAP